MVVFLSHVSGQRMTGGFLWQFGPYGSRAVIIFFVLSGFVIGYVADQRERTPRIYVASRAARLYSVAIPALLITFVLDAIGRQIDPTLYSSTWGYVAGGRWIQAISALTFTNQIWFRNVPPGSDLPYWSLGYEVWYYVFFGLILFVPRRWRAPALVVAFAIAGPKIVAFFPLWLLGVLTYRFGRARDLPTELGAGVGSLLCVAPIALWVFWRIAVDRWHLNDVLGFQINGGDPLECLVIAVLFATHLVGIQTIAPNLRFLLAPAGPAIRWVAGATFALYLFHLPIVQFLAAVLPGSVDAVWRRGALMIGTLVLVFLAAELTERRKNLWRRWFLAILPSTPASFPSPEKGNTP